MKFVADLEFAPGEGYLYRSGDGFFIVYTGRSREGWDACPTNPPPGEHRFEPHIVAGAATREDAVRRLAAR